MTGSGIGGYLELERFSGPMLHDGLIALNSGRSCLEYLAELRHVGALLLPDYLCSSVPDLCGRVGVPVITYRVGADLLPDPSTVPSLTGEWLYLVDYFGQLGERDVRRWTRAFGGRVIVDESQGYYREPWDGADTLYTCRKWFGVADGAFLSTHDGLRLGRPLPRGESFRSMGFVLGRFERPAGEFLGESRRNNARFASEGVTLMSLLTENLLRAVDYEAARLRRVGNWRLLDAALGGLNGLDLSEPHGPFMYPLLVDDGPALKRRLIERGVFVPTLWPNVLDDAPEGSVAHRYASDIVPLPLDQRYGEGEMEQVVEAVLGEESGGGAD